MRTVLGLCVLLLAACDTKPDQIAPDAGETAVVAASKAAVDDTDAALRDSNMNGTN